MNKQHQIIVTGVAVLVLAISALAETIVDTQTDTSRTGGSGNTQINRIDNPERIVRERDVSDRLSRVTTNTTASGSSATRIVQERDRADRVGRVVEQKERDSLTTTNGTAWGRDDRGGERMNRDGRSSTNGTEWGRNDRGGDRMNRDSRITTNGTAAATTTASDYRDRDNRALTRFDQGNSPADTDTTAQIRKAIHADKSMSMHAKNVQIITNKGRVIMRGPVKNEEEKRLIGEIANRIALPANVENQLEVSNETRGN